MNALHWTGLIFSLLLCFLCLPVGAAVGALVATAAIRSSRAHNDATKAADKAKSDSQYDAIFKNFK